MIAVVLSEEYAKLDGAVGSLSNLAPKPHVPRINSYFPNLSDAGLDYQRLLQRLKVYGLCEVKVTGDGNCQFRALSDQMYKSPEHHKYVRKEVVKQLKDYSSLYEGYVPMKYKSYYKKMAKSGEWGDHVTLQAAADKVLYCLSFTIINGSSICCTYDDVCHPFLHNNYNVGHLFELGLFTGQFGLVLFNFADRTETDWPYSKTELHMLFKSTSV